MGEEDDRVSFVWGFSEGDGERERGETFREFFRWYVYEISPLYLPSSFSFPSQLPFFFFAALITVQLLCFFASCFLPSMIRTGLDLGLLCLGLLGSYGYSLCGLLV